MKKIAQLILIVLLARAAGAQSEQVLYSFTAADGSAPFGVVSDASGNLYGVLTNTKYSCCGSVYELSPVGDGWKVTILHQFEGGLDGANPIGSLTFDSRGNLFGVTEEGGTPAYNCDYRCGTVFELSPQAGGGWAYKQIYAFKGNYLGDGEFPDAGVILDAAGNVYGTTENGGGLGKLPECVSAGCGTVFELSPNAGGWTESVLYKFAGGTDGAYPRSPLLFASNGDLIGATSQGGNGDCSLGVGAYGCGTVFQLVPAGGAWTENVIHRFERSDGEIPYQGIVSDAAGNLYGTTNLGGVNGYGTIYELSPEAGVWKLTTLFQFTNNSDGIWPAAGLAMDAAGNFYGTASIGGAGGDGTVLKFTQTSGAFAPSLLNAFSGSTGGATPQGGLALDSAGNVYGTTLSGGAYNYGAVYKITP